MLERGGIRKCLFEGATSGFVGAGGPVKSVGCSYETLEMVRGGGERAVGCRIT